VRIRAYVYTASVANSSNAKISELLTYSVYGAFIDEVPEPDDVDGVVNKMYIRQPNRDIAPWQEDGTVRSTCIVFCLIP
jgi:hypothetical protein